MKCRQHKNEWQDLVGLSYLETLKIFCLGKHVNLVNESWRFSVFIILKFSLPERNQRDRATEACTLSVCALLCLKSSTLGLSKAEEWILLKSKLSLCSGAWEWPLQLFSKECQRRCLPKSNGSALLVLHFFQFTDGD